MTHIKSIYLKAFALTLALSGGAFAQDGDRAEILQSGSNNTTSITQKGNANEASINLYGYSNGQTNGTLTQEGDGAFAKIYIEGDENNFSVTQETASSLFSGVYGDGNTLSVDQVNAYSDAYQNYGATLQSGYGNSATLEQQVEAYGASGGLNEAFINQYGNDNVALLDQTGTDNLAVITQEGNGNTGTLIQNGVGLSAALNQIGNNLPGYTITQDCIASAACNQDITVNQTNTASGFLTPSAGS